MTFDRKALGARAENMAAAHLEGRGYRVRHRNFRLKLGEVDLICEDGAAVVFVEVKARRSSAFGSAGEAVDRRKQAKLMAIAELYMARLPGRSCRFDVVLVTFDRGEPRLEHLVNAFP